MRFLFFQNCISPHQMPYIEALCDYDVVEEICVVVPRITYGHRAELGWPESWTHSDGKLRVLLSPSDKEVNRLFDRSGDDNGTNECHTVALFSGITAFPEVKHWLDMSLVYPLIQRGIITEAPFVGGKRWLQWLHRVRFLLRDYRYIHKLQYVFAIGEDCESYYMSWSKHWKVIPFMYCTQQTPCLDGQPTKEMGPELKILFVGALEPRKNVQVLLEALKDVRFEYSLTLVGDGPLRSRLEQLAMDWGIHAVFEGTLSNDKVPALMSGHDLLVLPSLHDGWGAVVNEAAMVGTMTICSDRCGARSISNYVFDVDKPEELRQIMSGIASNLTVLRSERKIRKNWAETNISPCAVAKKMMMALQKTVDN